MTKDEGSLLFAVDGREDEQEFIGLFPEHSRFVCGHRGRLYHHSEPVFGFLRLLLARSNFVHEVLLRHRFLGLAVVGSYARATSHQLPDEGSRYSILNYRAAKGYDLFSKLCSPLFELVHRLQITRITQSRPAVSLVTGSLVLPWSLSLGHWSFSS
jgi:hypothetical protein